MNHLLSRRLPGWLASLCLLLGLLAALPTRAQHTAPPADLDFTPIETAAPPRARPAATAAAQPSKASQPAATAKPSKPFQPSAASS
jgi:hypothetical protein